MSEIQVLAIGTTVIVDGEIPAVIRGVSIRGPHRVSYDCVWWDERTRKSEWLDADEFEVKEPRLQVVKFA